LDEPPGVLRLASYRVSMPKRGQIDRNRVGPGQLDGCLELPNSLWRLGGLLIGQAEPEAGAAEGRIIRQRLLRLRDRFGIAAGVVVRPRRGGSVECEQGVEVY